MTYFSPNVALHLVIIFKYFTLYLIFFFIILLFIVNKNEKTDTLIFVSTLVYIVRVEETLFKSTN